LSCITRGKPVLAAKINGSIDLDGALGELDHGAFSTFPFNRTVTPAAILMVVKLKIPSFAGLRGGTKDFGSKVEVPGVG
jgi:hypothetical protein